MNCNYVMPNDDKRAIIKKEKREKRCFTETIIAIDKNLGNPKALGGHHGDTEVWIQIL